MIYTKAEAEVILFDNCDVVTTSGIDCNNKNSYNDCSYGNSNGNCYGSNSKNE